MPMYTTLFRMLLSLAGIMLLATVAPAKDPGVVLYTPYTRISVPPGQSIDYKVEIINNTSTTKKVDLRISGLPKDWEYSLKSGGWSISEMAVLPDEKKDFTLRVEVPIKIKKGTYRFSVLAPGFATLPLSVTVSEEGTFKTELVVKQANLQGNATSNFTFNGELKNRTSEIQLYSLRSSAPRGWVVNFRAAGKQVSSVEIEPNQTENVSIEVNPPDAVAAGSYKIPVTATSSGTSATQELEVVITGSYSLELTTPTGLLSTKITAGDERRIPLLVRNTGSADLQNIKMSFSAPLNWDVVFEPKEITTLAPGKSTEVFATIKADKDAIAGDYVTNLEAKVPETSSKASFRVSVKTPLLYGWIGVMIIGGATSGVFYLFRKYGRR